jgi:tetratricopeptide (TPR) repeat protein/DNA-binding winged helix-turn-helix (wHTH) protein
MDLGEAKIVRVEDVEIDLQSRSIRRDGTTSQPRARSFDLLIYLIEHRGRVVSKDELFTKLWRNAVTEDSLVQYMLELRRALGDDARNPRFIRSVSKSGYQWIGRLNDTGAPAPSIVEAAPRPAPPRVSRRRPRLWGGIAAAAIVGVVLWLWVVRSRSVATPPNEPGTQQVLVLYFENQSRTPELDWLREGLADMLIASLSRSPKITVLSREQMAALARRAGWNTDTAPRLEEALAMSSNAHAQILLLGKFGRAGDEIRITVQMHRARDGSLLRTETASTRRVDEVIGQMGLLSERLSHYLDSSERKVSADTGAMPMTSNLEAYRAYSMGVQHVAVLQLAEGVQLLERAVDLDPQFAAAYAALGSAYAVSWGRGVEGKPYLEKAFALANRLTERQRMYVVAWYALANMDYAEAIQGFRKVVAKYPSDAEAYCSLGRLLEGEGRYDEAIATEKQGLTADPDDPLLHNFLARVYCRAGKFDQALTESKRYVEITGGEPNAYDSLGTTYMWQGKYAEAEAAYREALRRKPDFDIAQVHLAGVYYRQGRYRDAIAELKQYLRFAPADVDQARGNAWLAWIHLRRGDVAKSREAVALQAQVNGPVAFMGRAMLAIKSGDLAGAHKIIAAAGVIPERGNRGSDRYRPYLRGLLALAENKGDEAIAEFKKVLAQPEPVGYVDWFEDCLADGYLKLGRLDDALAEYQRVLGRNPNAALARYHLAEACARKGDRNLAREEYQQFLDIWKDADSDLPEVRIARAAVAH